MADLAIAIDVKQLHAAGRALKKVPREQLLAMRRDLRKIGRAIRDEAIAKSREHLDPSAFSVRTQGPRVIVRVAAKEEPPHRGKAVAFENAGREGEFRHPVFGNRDAWVSQRADPTLTRTAEVNYVRFQQEIVAAVDRAFANAGFR